jgi:hypothetical protein
MFNALSECVDDVHGWFLMNGMLLNPSKMDTVLFGSQAHWEKFDTPSGINVSGSVISFGETVILLGVALDSKMILDHHVTEVVHGCHYLVRALRHIRSSLNLDAVRMIAQGIIAAWWTIAVDCFRACQNTVLTNLRWFRKCLPEQCVKLHGCPVALSCVRCSASFLYIRELMTSWHSSCVRLD